MKKEIKTEKLKWHIRPYCCKNGKKGNKIMFKQCGQANAFNIVLRRKLGLLSNTVLNRKQFENIYIHSVG